MTCPIARTARRLLPAAAALALLYAGLARAFAAQPTTAPAGQPATSPAAKPDEPRVSVLFTRVLEVNDEGVLLQGGVAIAGPPHRWYAVRFDLLLDKGKSLRAGREPIVLAWNNLFTPEATGPVRWTDLRVALSRATLRKATNLVAGKRQVVWVACTVYDYANRRIAGHPWQKRCPLIVTTGGDGAILSIDTFRTAPADPPANPTGPGIGAEELRPTWKSLKLRPGVRLARATERTTGRTFDLLVGPRRQCLLNSHARGAFFQPIRSAATAEELAALDAGGDILLLTHEQYSTIRKVLDVAGHSGPNLLPVRTPPSVGLEATAEPSLGFRVSLLVLRVRGRLVRNIVHRQYAIAYDGRLGVRETVCIVAPPLLGTAAGKLDATQYDRLVRAALTAQGHRAIPLWVQPTGRAIAIPQPVRPADGWWSPAPSSASRPASPGGS